MARKQLEQAQLYLQHNSHCRVHVRESLVNPITTYSSVSQLRTCVRALRFTNFRHSFHWSQQTMVVYTLACTGLDFGAARGLRTFAGLRLWFTSRSLVRCLRQALSLSACHTSSCVCINTLRCSMGPRKQCDSFWCSRHFTYCGFKSRGSAADCH